MKKTIATLIICMFIMTHIVVGQAAELTSQGVQVEVGITFVDEVGGNESGEGLDVIPSELPQTGDSRQSGIPIVGLMMVVVAFYHLIKKKCKASYPNEIIDQLNDRISDNIKLC